MSDIYVYMRSWINSVEILKTFLKHFECSFLLLWTPFLNNIEVPQTAAKLKIDMKKNTHTFKNNLSNIRKQQHQHQETIASHIPDKAAHALFTAKINISLSTNQN